MAHALSNQCAAPHRHGRTMTAQPPARAFVALYHSDTVNHCPGCGGTHWHVGRMSAECAMCETALPLAQVAAQPMRPLFHVTSSATLQAA